MLDFLKRHKSDTNNASSKEGSLSSSTDNTPPISMNNTSNSMTQLSASENPAGPKAKGLLGLKTGLIKTRKSFREGLANLFLGQKEIDADILDELEALLLSSDLGVEVVAKILKDLSKQLERKQLQDRSALLKALKAYLVELLRPYEKPLEVPSQLKPWVILMVGVNGAGKTTTIGKMAAKWKAEGKQLLLAAGDTFRAAAIEQLQSWAEKSQIPVIAQHSGADSASVIYDAFQAAQSRSVDILIADTAGRLHTQDNLMEELKKVVRVIKKQDASLPHEILLVLDAGIGQNAVMQAKKFHEAIGVTGLILTKLDGTAKGGVIFNIANSLKLPIRFIGLGERAEDLRPFEAEAFVEALFAVD